MNISVAVSIQAPRETVWSVVSDVAHWPEWTASVTSVEPVGGGKLALGSRVRIKQPRFPAAVWRVTGFDPGRAFCWQTGNILMRAVGCHEVQPESERASRAILNLSQTGALFVILAPWLCRISRRYVEMEAAGLKQQCESMAR